MSGYRSAEYAAALVDLGRPVALPNCGGWLLERAIPGTNLCDAIGCYPLFRCANWPELGNDIDGLRKRFVTVALVPDPFGDPPADLAGSFPDVCSPFKEHFGVDFSRDWRGSISRHHRRNVRAGARSVEVEHCEDPPVWLGILGSTCTDNWPCDIESAVPRDFPVRASNCNWAFPASSSFEQSRAAKLWRCRSGTSTERSFTTIWGRVTIAAMTWPRCLRCSTSP